MKCKSCVVVCGLVFCCGGCRMGVVAVIVSDKYSVPLCYSRSSLYFIVMRAVGVWERR